MFFFRRRRLHFRHSFAAAAAAVMFRDIACRRFRFRHIDRPLSPITAFADAADSPFSII
jgi:hypothetical protein